MRACELSPCFCFASVLSLLEKVGGLKGVGFFILLGITLSISAAARVLTDFAVGMCLVGGRKKNDGSDGEACIRGLCLRSINY